MVFAMGETGSKRCSFENAVDLTGYGKYNIGMLVTCCLLILAMYMDIFGFSVVMPAVTCDMSLDTAQQGLLSAMPLIGVMLSSYCWGLSADTIGRRKSLLIAMPVGFVLNFAATMAPNYATLAIVKFFSAAFTSSANAAAFVLMAESVPSRQRSRFMFIMASATMCVQFIICSFAIPIFKLQFRLDIPWLGMQFRPWRLLMMIISLPGAFGVLGLLFLKESPKFLLSKSRDDEALAILQSIFKCNTGHKMNAYSVMHVYLEEPPVTNTETSILKKMWNQTAPLFKSPLLKNSAILYYLLLCAYMTSTGFTMWVPTMTNAFFMGENSSGHTFCEVASRSAHAATMNPVDCDHVIQPMTLYAVMCYSMASTLLLFLLSFIVASAGKKTITLLVFLICTICGILLMFVRIPLLSIALFYLFLYVAIILGNVNTYLVDLNPTHLRGMATCLSVVVARGFGFFSVQLIANLLGNYCTPMISGYIVLVFSGMLVACLLPPDRKPKDKDNKKQEAVNEISTHETPQNPSEEKTYV